MRKLLIVCACLFISDLAICQQSPYGTGLIQQPNAVSARHYLGVTNSQDGIIAGANITFTVGLDGRITISSGGGGGGGTVTTFSSGNLNPLFTTSVANPGTTPALSFAQISQNQNLVFASPNGAPGNPSFRSLVSGDIPALPYVTSVSLALPVSVFSISGSPVTGAGTLTGSFQNQSANTVFAGPTSGGATTPAFRALVAGDIPRTPFSNHSDTVVTTLQPGDIFAYNGAGSWTNGPPASTGGAGTVTSVGLSTPQEFSVSGSPVTTSGTLTFSRGNDANFLGFGATNLGNTITTNLQAQVITNTGTKSAPFIYTDSGGKHLVGIVGQGLTFDAPSGTLSNSNPNQVSLPGLLDRPVKAAPDGSLSAPTWPDDSVYTFDEEFDSMGGTTGGQFGRNFWSFTSVGGGGGINLSTTNEFPHFGMAILQSPTGANTSGSLEQFASSLQPPYPGLGTNPNWLYHSVVRLATSNVGSIYRIGLEDTGFSTIAQSQSPSNCIVVRWDKNKNDPNNFIFEACSNATRTLANSTVRPNTNNWIDITMFSTNAGTVLCAINGESWVTLTNIPTAPVGLVFTTAVTNGVAEFLWIDRVSFMVSGLSR